jgi:hypothetical protein
MLKTKSNALKVVEATLGKITGVNKPVAKFVIHIVELWLGMNCRYVFSNMERWGNMTEKSYRNGFKKFFDWFGFNFTLAKQHGGKELIAVFDPSHIGKSGKRTYGLGMFWSGTRQKALKGIEIGCLAFIDVAAATALHGEAVQTPSPQSLKSDGKTLVTHYVEVVKKAYQRYTVGYPVSGGGRLLHEKRIYQPFVQSRPANSYQSPQRCQPDVCVQGQTKSGQGKEKAV